MDMEQFKDDHASAHASSWVNGRPIVSMLYLRANLDPSGNPRRVFAGIDERGSVVAVTDEGFVGEPVWVRAATDAGICAVSIDIPVSQYTRLMGIVERNRGPWGIFGGADDATPYKRLSTRARALRAARRDCAWAEIVNIREVIG